MNTTTTPIQRKLVIALVCGVALVALLYQVASGWDTGAFLLRASGAVLLALLAWRGGILLGRGRGSRVALYVVAATVVAAALFAGLRLGA